jgi:hypothetical protein
MGLLVPEDFPMSLLANDEERLVVQALRDAAARRLRAAHAFGLTVVGPRAIAERLGLEDRSPPLPSL